MRVVVRAMAKKRMSTYVDERIKRKIDYALGAVGWSESDFLVRAIENYYPFLHELAKKLGEGERVA